MLIAAISQNPIFLEKTGFSLQSARGLYRRSGIAPCPEGLYSVVEIIPNYSALTMHSTGQTEAHWGESWWPTHSTQVAASITYKTPSPSVIESVGHSGMHAPQAMHSSWIFIAMVNSPIF
jgi:hypothetical protein